MNTQRPLKVCLISLWGYELFRPDVSRSDSFGGAEVQQFQLATALSKNSGYSVTVIVEDSSVHRSNAERFKVGKRSIMIRKISRNSFRINLIDRPLKAWQLYRAMAATSADVYLIRGGGSLAGMVAFFAKNLLSKKFIYSSAHDRDSNLDFFKKHNFFSNFLFRYALKKADAVICQHLEQQKAFKENLGIRATVIPSMYPIPPLSPSKRSSILWVSRLVEWKQPELFVELSKYFPNEQFLLITNSSSPSFLRALKSQGNLKVIQNVPFSSMDDYFRGAKLFINTSRYEGFPNTFVQAAKNGTPIVSLSVNPDEILDSYSMGKCAGGDFKKLIDHTKKILNDSRCWATMSKNAYRYAQKNHDISSIINAYKVIIPPYATDLFH